LQIHIQKKNLGYDTENRFSGQFSEIYVLSSKKLIKVTSRDFSFMACDIIFNIFHLGDMEMAAVNGCKGY